MNMGIRLSSKRQVAGAVVGQGATYEEAYNDVVSALNTHVSRCGPEVLEADFPVLEAYIAEYIVSLKSNYNARIPR
jgi:hypothetical protein